MLGEGEALQLLAEVLDHVVPLELAVDEHVETDLFLHADGPFDLGRKEGLVGGRVHIAPPERRARLADLRGLREGTDRRRWKQRKFDERPLHLAAQDVRLWRL